MALCSAFGAEPENVAARYLYNLSMRYVDSLYGNACMALVKPLYDYAMECRLTDIKTGEHKSRSKFIYLLTSDINGGTFNSGFSVNYVPVHTALRTNHWSKVDFHIGNCGIGISVQFLLKYDIPIDIKISELFTAAMGRLEREPILRNLSRADWVKFDAGFAELMSDIIRDPTRVINILKENLQ